MDFNLSRKDSSLVLYLPLYELDGASFMSKDKHGHLGTVTGAVWTPQGHSFDGEDDKINCGRAAILCPTPITLIAWVEATLTNPYNSVESFESSGKGHTLLVKSNGKVAVVLAVTGTGGSYNGAGNFTLVAGEWYCLAYTYDQANLVGFVNAEIDATVATTGTVEVPTTEDFLIGDSFYAGRLWDRYIGEIWVYNRALTPLEIQHNYLATKRRYQ